MTNGGLFLCLNPITSISSDHLAIHLIHITSYLAVLGIKDSFFYVMNVKETYLLIRKFQRNTHTEEKEIKKIKKVIQPSSLGFTTMCTLLPHRRKKKNHYFIIARTVGVKIKNK